MTNATYEKGLKLRKEVLGAAHVERSLANADEFSKPMQEMVTELGWGTFWWIEPVRVVWSSAVIVALVATAVFATAFAFAVQSWAQKHTTPTRTALIFALEPVFAWVTSFLMTGEVLTERTGFGAVAVLAGILLVDLSPRGTA